MFGRIRNAAAAFLAAGLLSIAFIAAVGVAPASAYGAANWQTTFAGTANFPSTGNSFGFWGWCDFAGGVTSGNSGDCQFAQYAHSPSGSGFTCHESLDLTAWNTEGGTFLATGTAIVTPAAQTVPCLAFFPGGSSTSFTDANTLIPAAPGHYAFGVAALAGPGAVGEWNATVTELK